MAGEPFRRITEKTAIPGYGRRLKTKIEGQPDFVTVGMIVERSMADEHAQNRNVARAKISREQSGAARSCERCRIMGKGSAASGLTCGWILSLLYEIDEAVRPFHDDEGAERHRHVA